MIGLYNTLFYYPVFNALILLYEALPGNDLGVAIIILTVLIRVILYPLSVRSIRAQKALQELQPKLEAVKAKYGGDREQLAKETMRLYKEEKINPLSSCLPLLLQLPFLIAIFHAFRNVTNPENLQVLYSFVPVPEQIHVIGLFGLLNLSEANWIIAILAGAAQFWQGKMLVLRRPKIKGDGSKDEDFATLMNQQMVYVMPVVTTVIAWSFPSGLALYWFLSTFLLALQQWFIFRPKHAAGTS